MLKRKVAPAVFLTLYAPLSGEVLSGNSPIAFLATKPQIFVLFLAIYGIPVMLIREAATRWKLNAAGVILLGFAYGIYNEGPLAGTLFLYDHAPMPVFDWYGCAFGINVSWASTILFYHAFNSVFAPIAIANYLFQDRAQKSWITKPVMIG